MMNILRRRQRRLVEAVDMDPPIYIARPPVIPVPITQTDETTSIVVHGFTLAITTHSNNRPIRTGLVYEWHLARPIVATDGDTVQFNIKINKNGTAVMTSRLATPPDQPPDQPNE